MATCCIWEWNSTDRQWEQARTVEHLLLRTANVHDKFPAKMNKRAVHVPIYPRAHSPLHIQHMEQHQQKTIHFSSTGTYELDPESKRISTRGVHNNQALSLRSYRWKSRFNTPQMLAKNPVNMNIYFLCSRENVRNHEVYMIQTNIWIYGWDWGRPR